MLYSLPVGDRFHWIRVDGPGGGGRGLPYKRLMGMCCWMGSHFHVWIDYNGVTFSLELLEWSRTFSDSWGKTVLADEK